MTNKRIPYSVAKDTYNPETLRLSKANTGGWCKRPGTHMVWR